jgi:hypothetical protein
MDKWLTVPPDLEPFIGTALALYSLYRPKKTLLETESHSWHAFLMLRQHSDTEDADTTVSVGHT